MRWEHVDLISAPTDFTRKEKAATVYDVSTWKWLPI